ncbi:hypothetical protein M4R22_20730 [Acidovorax sp. GBBC 3334]|uniref:hypothetical protein n=1 Tax=Acidovorax sp. GBBC 3334 TaxID=2940496 RepID=UPI002304CCCD|nr:hypothetical protein [Acidovorax sp. GBBC 3334]MDA8457190.1 hypothetical protein [Acidovorax sp. GBBC 3334]
MSVSAAPRSPASSPSSSPSRRYALRTALFMAVYSLLHIAAIVGAFDAWIGTSAGWWLALAVALPIAGQVWALMRLIADSDEYLRALWAKRVILSAGIVLVVCTVWGFGETYANAPGMKAWLVLPLFWAVSAVVWPFVRSSR